MPGPRAPQEHSVPSSGCQRPANPAWQHQQQVRDLLISGVQCKSLNRVCFILHQDGEEEFNRAKLLNIGFTEALKEYDYDCFVFSDVDLIPMDDRNTYKCYSQPRHLSVSMDKFGFR